MMQLLNQPIFEGPEGLRVTVSQRGYAGFETGAGTAHLTPERAVALAFELLGTYAPEVMEAVERAVRAQRLRVVRGGDPGGDAA